MKSIKRDLKKKIKKNAGVTIAESLVALLITALAIGILSTAVSTAANAIQKAKNVRKVTESLMDAYVTDLDGGEEESVSLSGSREGEDASFTLDCQLSTHTIHLGEEDYEIYDFSK